MAGTYGPGVAESVRVMPRPVKTPDFGQNARDYVKSTEAERHSLIQSGANQPRLDSLTSNAFGALDQANIDIALGNYPRITNYENGGPVEDEKNVSTDILHLLKALPFEGARGLSALKKGLPILTAVEAAHSLSQGNGMRAVVGTVPFLPNIADKVAPG